MLLEREIRDAEMLMDGQSLRADIVRLQRSTGMQLSVPNLSDVLPDMDDASAAAKLQGAMFLEAIEGSPVPSHTKSLWVLRSCVVCISCETPFSQVSVLGDAVVKTAKARAVAHSRRCLASRISRRADTTFDAAVVRLQFL